MRIGESTIASAHCQADSRAGRGSECIGVDFVISILMLDTTHSRLREKHALTASKW
jgi:hypothetical protein